MLQVRFHDYEETILLTTNPRLCLSTVKDGHLLFLRLANILNLTIPTNQYRKLMCLFMLLLLVLLPT